MTMNTIHRIAQRQVGMSFEEWKQRPVYKAHCATFKAACALSGLQLAAGEGLATSHPGGATAGLTTFRCLPPFRDAAAIALRARVARHMRDMRRQAHRGQ